MCWLTQLEEERRKQNKEVGSLKYKEEEDLMDAGDLAKVTRKVKRADSDSEKMDEEIVRPTEGALLKATKNMKVRGLLRSRSISPPSQ